MDVISGLLFVGIVYLVLMSVFSLVIGLPVPLSMALSLLGALILVVGNRQRVNRWMQPSPRDKKRLSPRLRSGNRAARRSKH